MSDAATEAPTRRDLIIRALWDTEANGGRREPMLYAVLDAAQDARIHRELRKLAAREAIVPLYQEPAATDFANVAPYLVKFGGDMRMFNWILADGWGRSWGIFLWSARTTDLVRAHLRTLTKIRTESGDLRLFRFYDPRVMAGILPILDRDQIRTLFGPITRISVEAGFGREIASYTHDDGILACRTAKV